MVTDASRDGLYVRVFEIDESRFSGIVSEHLFEVCPESELPYHLSVNGGKTIATYQLDEYERRYAARGVRRMPPIVVQSYSPAAGKDSDQMRAMFKIERTPEGT